MARTGSKLRIIPMNGNDTSAAGEPAGDPARGPATLSRRILLVDDDAVIRKVNAEVLRRVGYQTETANDGEAAWGALQAKGFDLLITDHNMPKVSGVELVQKVRSAQMTLPVILASGAMPAEELNRLPWLQIEARLLKPFTGGELLATVRKVLRASDCAPAPLAPLPNWRNQSATVGSRR